MKDAFFDAARFEELRRERGVTWGRPVRVLSQVASTNDEALSAVLGEAKTGIVWVAREQTKGRGRRGNSWLVPPGDGLTFSVLLRYRGPYERLVGLSLAVGLAIRDAADVWLSGGKVPGPVEVKWPNDVMVRGKKLAGVLIETKADPEGGFGLVIGIGINVHTANFPEALSGATSLRGLGLSRNNLAFEGLLVDVLLSLEKRVGTFLKSGFSALSEDIARHDFLLGQEVRVGDEVGIAKGLDAGGRLLLEDRTGALVVIESGHVEILSR